MKASKNPLLINLHRKERILELRMEEKIWREQKHYPAQIMLH